MQQLTDRQLAQSEKWFVVQNGAQIDIHARVFPKNAESREITVHSNLKETEARRTVGEHNAAIAERLADSRREINWL